MMLFLVRIPLTILFAYTLIKATLRYPELLGGDVVFLLGYGLAGAVLMAILWAPVIGEKLSDPVTSTLTQETSLPPQTNQLIRWITWLQIHGYHRPALVLVFVEGIRHPDLPQPSLLGLRSVRPGSLLERWFAREVYKFNNVQNCLHAYKILTERHGKCPPLHKHPEVNLAVMNLNREPPPEPAKIPLKPSEQTARPERNRRIKLFEE